MRFSPYRPVDPLVLCQKVACPCQRALEDLNMSTHQRARFKQISREADISMYVVFVLVLHAYVCIQHNYRLCMHVFICTHTHARTHPHGRKHGREHVRTHARTHARMRVHSPPLAHMNTHANALHHFYRRLRQSG